MKTWHAGGGQAHDIGQALLAVKQNKKHDWWIFPGLTFLCLLPYIYGPAALCLYNHYYIVLCGMLSSESMLPLLSILCTAPSLLCHCPPASLLSYLTCLPISLYLRPHHLPPSTDGEAISSCGGGEGRLEGGLSLGMGGKRHGGRRERKASCQRPLYASDLKHLCDICHLWQKFVRSTTQTKGMAARWHYSYLRLTKRRRRRMAWHACCLSPAGTLPLHHCTAAPF